MADSPEKVKVSDPKREDAIVTYSCLLNWHNKLGKVSPLRLVDNQSKEFGEIRDVLKETESLIILREPMQFADGQKRKFGALTSEGRFIALSVKIINDVDTIDFGRAKEVFDISIDSGRQNMKAVINSTLNQTMVDMKKKSNKISTILENLVVS